MNYTIMHKGNGNFDVLFKDETIKEAGPNLCGIIRYTYFEDFTLPPLNWQIDNITLLTDYNKKVSIDISIGKINTDSNSDDYIEIL